MTACYVGYALVFGLSGHWVKDRNSPLYAAEVKNFLYRIVVLLLRYKRQDTLRVRQIVLVLFKYFKSVVVEIYFDCLWIVFYGLMGDVLDKCAETVGADAVFAETVEVADAATGQALEYEYVPLSFKHRGL